MTTIETDQRLLDAIDRLDHRFQSVEDMAARLARLEDQSSRLRDTVVVRSDLSALGGRIETLSGRIDLLAEQVAGSGPRLSSVESQVGELRASSARQVEVDALQRSLADLDHRLDASDRGHSARAARLSNQVTAWLVSLLFLIVGAMVSYAFVAGR